MRKDSLEPEDFEDDLELHTKCGLIYYIHSIVCLVFDLFGIVLMLVLFMYPELHRKSVLYSHILQSYDRTRAYQYHIFYNFVTFACVFLFFSHILAIGIGLFGVKLRKPYLMHPQVVLLAIRLFLLVILSCGLVTLNFVGSEFVLLVTFSSLLFTFVAGSYLVTTVFCLRYVREKYLMIQRILASTKSVHFKDRKRKK